MKLNKFSIPVTIGLILLTLFPSCKPGVDELRANRNNPLSPAPVNQGVAPYKFEVGILSIVPQEAKAGTTVIVSLPVRNIGSATNAFIATMYVDGNEYSTEDVTLQSGSKGSITFLLSGLGPGEHIIEVAGKKGNLRLYYPDRYSITNNHVFLPKYTPLEYTPAPPLPHLTSDSFTPPVLPFFITQISFRYPFPQSFEILDSGGKQLYRAEIDYKQSADIPSVRVDGDFEVQMLTPQPTADIRSQYYGPYSWKWVISYYWPEVSIVEGFQKNCGP